MKSARAKAGAKAPTKGERKGERGARGVVLAGLVGARSAQARVEAAHRSFLFRDCFARAAGSVLTVSFPAGPLSVRFGVPRAAGGVRWTPPRRVARAVDVRCAAGAPTPFDRRAWPKAPAPPAGVVVRFHGAVRFCRLVLPDGPALLVQGRVSALAGLPGGRRPFDTAEFLSAPAAPRGPLSTRSKLPDGGIDPSGPHLPFP